LRLRTSLGDELRSILCRGFESIDELSFAFLPILAFFVLFAADVEGTLFPELSVVLFLFLESLCGLFLTLDVELDQGGVFCAVCLYSSFRLRNIDVVYQVESCGRI